MSWDGGYDLPRHWPEVRRRVLRRDPVCMLCEREPSTVADHKVNRASTDRDWSKIRLMDHVALCQGLCKGCHDRKTARESAAGKAKIRAAVRRPAERHPGMRG